MVVVDGMADTSAAIGVNPAESILAGLAGELPAGPVLFLGAGCSFSSSISYEDENEDENEMRGILCHGRTHGLKKREGTPPTIR